MLLRSIVPQLYVHLEEEELEPNKWAVSWLQWLLCKELPFDCCLRLWVRLLNSLNPCTQAEPLQTRIRTLQHPKEMDLRYATTIATLNYSKAICQLHMFVCLAILETCQNDLIELEQPELYAFLQHLPALDMDRIINKAQYLYRSVKF